MGGPSLYLSCTQRRKLGSSTAARTPSSIVSGSSSAKQQPQAATSQSAAAATYRAARPRKQFWRASLRHCSADRRPAILKKERHIHHVSENCGCVYKQRSSTTSPSTFMPESATLPCMRHVLAYLSRTFENHHLAISLKTPFLMNCDCLTFSCY